MPDPTLDRPFLTVTARHVFPPAVRVFEFTSGRVDVELGDSAHVVALGGERDQLRAVLVEAVRQLDDLESGGRR